MKKIITIVGVALLILAFGGVTLAAAPSTINAAEVSPQIEGTWLATIALPNGATFPSLVTYARGGALTVTDSSVSPTLGNLYQGTWVKTGPHEFAFTFLGFNYDEAGALTGYVRAHETLQLDPGGEAYTGEAIIEIMDLEMNVFVRDSSTSYATRIDAE